MIELARCAGYPVANYFNPGEYEVLRGCVRASGIATGIVSRGPNVLFDLVPGPATLAFETAINRTTYKGTMLVAVHGRSRIHGRLLNGSHVSVLSPLVYYRTNGDNVLISAMSIEVVPPAAPSTPLTVRVGIAPNAVKAGDVLLAIAYTADGARCRATVVDVTGAHATTIDPSWFPAKTGGYVTWTWLNSTPATAGTINVECSRGTQRATGTARFTAATG
jgi:hypothetical protein